MSFDIIDTFDIYLCNPPFNNDCGQSIYPYFFCKLLSQLQNYSCLYFICPKMWYTDQMSIKLDIKFDHYTLKQYIESYHSMPVIYQYEKYGLLELHSNYFRFNNKMVERMLDLKLIDHDFIKQYVKNEFTINPYFEFRYLRDIFDFKTTKCRCGLFFVKK